MIRGAVAVSALLLFASPAFADSPAKPQAIGTRCPVAANAPARIVDAAPALLPPHFGAAGLIGDVLVRVTVDAQGRPIEERIWTSPNLALTNAAMDAADHSTYAPQTVNCQPASGVVFAQFSFASNRIAAVEPPRPRLCPYAHEDAVLAHSDTPYWPVDATSRGLYDGSVYVRTTVGANGKPTDVHILRSTDAVFESPAIAIAEKALYEPGKRECRPISGSFVLWYVRFDRDKP